MEKRKTQAEVWSGSAGIVHLAEREGNGRVTLNCIQWTAAMIITGVWNWLRFF
jgi:hypothetical protein